MTFFPSAFFLPLKWLAVLEKEIHRTKRMSETNSLSPEKHSALLSTYQYSSLETLSLWSGSDNVF